MYLIDIKKMADTQDYADYAFSASEADTPGALRLDKRTGEVVLLHPIAGGDIGTEPLGEWRAPERYFERAARKVRLAWDGGKGTLPASLTWAS